VRVVAVVHGTVGAPAGLAALRRAGAGRWRHRPASAPGTARRPRRRSEQVVYCTRQVRPRWRTGPPSVVEQTLEHREANCGAVGQIDHRDELGGRVGAGKPRSRTTSVTGLATMVPPRPPTRAAAARGRTPTLTARRYPGGAAGAVALGQLRVTGRERRRGARRQTAVDRAAHERIRGRSAPGFGPRARPDGDQRAARSCGSGRAQVAIMACVWTTRPRTAAVAVVRVWTNHRCRRRQASTRRPASRPGYTSLMPCGYTPRTGVGARSSPVTRSTDGRLPMGASRGAS
jgi:hypothetical protein